MHKTVKFHQNQQGVFSDHNDAQDHTKRTFDHLVYDAVTPQARFAGCLVEKDSETVAYVAVGRLYKEGVIYTHEDSNYTIDFFSQLPLSTEKVVAITLAGSEVETETEQRKFLIDATTRATQVQTIPTTVHRAVTISTVAGTEAAAPVKPTISADLVTAAWVTLDTSGIKSIEMNWNARLESVQKNDIRLTGIEDWRRTVGNRMDTLASDIAGLNSRMGELGEAEFVEQLAFDMGRVKELLELEDGHTDYGADRYLTTDESDTDNVNYLAKVEEGVRFSHDGEDELALELFNPINPDVSVNNGWLLPKYDHALRLAVERKTSEVSISQYSYQNVNYTLMHRTRQRTRYGEPFTVCNNNRWWKQGRFNYHDWTFRRAGETFEVVTEVTFGAGGHMGAGAILGKRYYKAHSAFRLRKVWKDTVREAYWRRKITNGTVNGSVVAQTFLNSQDGWMTKLDLAFTQVAASGNVDVILCHTKDGKPDLSSSIAKVTVDQADLKVWPTWTEIVFPPTFLKAGERYGIVLMTGGNHYVAMAAGESYAQGTFFYSTDGAFYMGDLTKDLCFKLHCARFHVPRLEVELDALSLSGGIAAIDILAETIIPDGTDLIYEIQPSGSTEWTPLDYVINGQTVLYNLPALCKLRAVFLGTSDVMPGVGLLDSRIIISRPRTTFKHISEPVTLASSTQSFKVIVTANEYYEDNHNLTCTLDDVTNATLGIVPATTITEDIEPGGDENHKRIKRTFEWTATELATATSEIVINLDGQTTSALDVFVVEERVHLAF